MHNGTPNSSAPLGPDHPGKTRCAPLLSASERGLLEQPILVVQRRPNADRVAFSDGTATVGFAVRQPSSGWLDWWPVLCVHEVIDSPLVFTVRRSGLLPRWEVRDAEGELVAQVTRRGVFDPWGRLRMTRATTGIQGMAGEGAVEGRLAEWAVVPAGLRLAFGESARHDPLARMAILAAVLVWQG